MLHNRPINAIFSLANWLLSALSCNTCFAPSPLAQSPVLQPGRLLGRPYLGGNVLLTNFFAGRTLLARPDSSACTGERFRSYGDLLITHTPANRTPCSLFSQHFRDRPEPNNPRLTLIPVSLVEVFWEPHPN